MNAIRLKDDTFLADVLEIEQGSFSLPWSKNVFQSEFQKDYAYYVGVLEGKKLVAYAGCWKVLDEGHITNIAVHPAFRRKGYGKKVVAYLLDLCRLLHIARVTLEVRRSNAVAIRLYQSLGFVGVGYRKGYYEDNKEDALIMWASLGDT